MDNKQIARRIFEEVFTKGKYEVADECVAPNHVSHDPNNPPGYVQGPEGLKMVARLYRGAFPDMVMTIDDQIAEGDRVVTRWSCRGTHTGNLAELPPTGRKVTVIGTSVERFASGKVVESWINWDFAGMMRQLGVGAPQQQQSKTDGGGARPQPHR